jgi:hypothetical protein
MCLFLLDTMQLEGLIPVGAFVFCINGFAAAPAIVRLFIYDVSGAVCNMGLNCCTKHGN